MRGRRLYDYCLPEPISPTPSAPRIAIVVSRYNGSITEPMREGALRAFARRGGDPASLLIVEAPGAFELTALSLAAAQRSDVAGVLALGCVIQGETRHDEYISHAVAQGLTQVSLQTGKPVAFGLLTCQTPAHAQARAGGAKGNKGEEAMEALLESLAALEAMHAGESGIPHGTTTRPDKAREQ